MASLVHTLPHVNATLNAIATVLLIAGFVLIRQRRERLHKLTMLSCFGISCLFLASYLTYHYARSVVLGEVSKAFPAYPPDWIRYSYYLILITHVILAAAVPFLAIATIYAGLRDFRKTHRRLARWTFPIWLYVSVTGVVVYVMLYIMFPAR